MTPETTEQAAAMDWVSNLVCSLPSFPARAQLGAAWNSPEALRHRAYLKANRGRTLEVLVQLVTEYRDAIPV